jgi:RNA polymerase sigma-70 factor (ECF subfamily)
MAWLRDIDFWFMDRVLPYRGVHLNYAHRLTGHRAEAEDIVQEAYARIFAGANWQGVAHPHAFAMRTIHNVAIDGFRSAGVVQMKQALRLDTFDPADERPSPEREVMARAELRRVFQALENLPERCRDVVRLRRIDGFSTTQIALRLGISVSTVEKHLVRGVRLLIAALKQPTPGQETEQFAEWSPSTGRQTGS